MPLHFVTFGQRYPREPHPFKDYADHNGWLTIDAPNERLARKAAFEELGQYWSMLYSEDEFDKSLYPKGELMRLTIYEPSPTHGPGAADAQ